MTDAMKQLERVPLVVAHPVPAEGGVLSTPVPIPTDQLPQRRRRLPNFIGSPAHDLDRHRYGPECPLHRCVPDGPFPGTVGIWSEVEVSGCTCWFCAGGLGAGHGAIVATVQVTGPSHHADECGYGPLDAPPDRWHTPTGTVTRLDVPIPMERPSLTPTAFGPTVIRSTRPLTERSEPAPWWWADLNLEAPA